METRIKGYDIETSSLKEKISNTVFEKLQANGIDLANLKNLNATTITATNENGKSVLRIRISSNPNDVIRFESVDENGANTLLEISQNGVDIKGKLLASSVLQQEQEEKSASSLKSPLFSATTRGSSVNDQTIFSKIRKIDVSTSHGKIKLNRSDIENYFPELLEFVENKKMIDFGGVVAALVASVKILSEIVNPLGETTNVLGAAPRVVGEYVDYSIGEASLEITNIDISGADYTNTDFGTLEGFISYRTHLDYHGEPQYILFGSLYLPFANGRHAVAHGDYYSTQKPCCLKLKEENNSGLSAVIYIDGNDVGNEDTQINKKFTVIRCTPMPILKPVSGVGEIVWQDQPREQPDGHKVVFTFHEIWRPYKIVVIKNGIELKNGKDVDIQTLNFGRKVIFNTPPQEGDDIWARYELYPQIGTYYGAIYIDDEPSYDLSGELPPYE